MPKRHLDEFDLEAERQGNAMARAFTMKKARSRRQTKEHAKTGKGQVVIENRTAGKFMLKG